MDKLSYALGHNIGHQLIGMGLQKSLNIDDFAAAVADILQGNTPKMSHEEVHEVLEHYFAELEERQQAEAAERGKAAKGEGEAFLAENLKKAGVVALASGLQYKILKAGNGRKPGKTSQVRCNYEGKFTNGQIFDSSYKRGEPAVFGVNQVIAGWTEALQLMSEGSEWELYIPYNLAYGETGAHGAIPPYAALIFKVELIEVL